MAPPRSGCAAPPQGGRARTPKVLGTFGAWRAAETRGPARPARPTGGPAEPDPRLLLEGTGAGARSSWHASFFGVFTVWPLPALLCWVAAWGVYRGLIGAGVAGGVAALVGLGLSVGGALMASTRMRRVIVAAGFPVSLVAGGLLTGWTALLWLAPLALLLLLYPVASWRDAPLFPTPVGALQGIDRMVRLGGGGRIVDAGCGLGAGLVELKAAFPQASIVGLEWSWPLVWACRLRHRFAAVRRADIWTVDWSGFDLVYLFQRPESMPRAVAKARAELRPGAWLASLEFEATELRPQARLEPVPGKPVWLYRAPFVAAPVRGVASTNAATSSATGASQRSGQAKAPTSVK